MEASFPARSTDRRARPVVDLLPGVVVAAAIVAVLASTAALEQTGDSLAYLRKARIGGKLFHPHHLLFSASVRLVYLGLDSVVGVRDVVLAAQIHNLAYAFVALLAVYSIGLRWLGSRSLGLIGLAFYGCATGTMVFASQAEVYVPSAACLGVATVFFLALVDSPKSKGARIGLVGSWVLAVLYHQTAVLFLIPMALAAGGARGRGLMRAIVVVTAQAGAVVFGAYWYAYRVMSEPDGSSGPISFLNFVLYYAFVEGKGWGSAANLDPPGVVALLRSHVWGLSALVPDLPAVLVGIAAAGVAAVAWAWLVAGPRPRFLLCFASSWAAVLLVFFLWWFPQEREFAVLTSMPLCIAATAAVAPVVLRAHLGSAWARCVVVGLLAIAAANFWVNLQLEVLPRHRARGKAYRTARFMTTFDDGSTLLLTSYVASTTMRFYFSGSESSIGVVDQLENSLHVGSLDLPWMTRSRWGRVVVDVAQIDPRSVRNGRNGFDDAAAWLEMMRWIFRLRGDPEGWRADVWEIVSDEDGNEYVLVATGSMPLSDPSQLLEQLAASLAPPRSDAGPAITAWLQANSELVARQLARLEP